MSRKELETGDRIPPGPLDSETEKEIDECVKFVLYVPSGRRKVEEAIKEKEKVEGSHSFVSSKRKVLQALETGNTGMLKTLASDPDEVAYEVVTKAGNDIRSRAIRASPLLIDLVLIPGEEKYARQVIEHSPKRRFNQERRFFTELLDTVSQGEVEECLKSFIGQINFRNRMFAYLTPARRYEILFSLFTRHLVYADYFQDIRDDFLKEAYPLPIKYFPSRVALSIHYQLLLYALSQRWPEIAQRHSLESEESFYAPAIIRRVEREKGAYRWLGEMQISLPFGEAIIIQAFASRNWALIVDRLRIPYKVVARVTKALPFLADNFMTQVKKLPTRGAANKVGTQALKLFKLWAFSEGRTLDPDEEPSRVKVFEKFMELAEAIERGDYKELGEPLNYWKIHAMQHLGRLLGDDEMRSLCDKLSEMPIEEREQLPKILQKRAVDELGIAERTAASDAWAIAAIIVDIENGLGYPEILYIKRKEKD